jgi:hypothetical protein
MKEGSFFMEWNNSSKGLSGIKRKKSTDLAVLYLDDATMSPVHTNVLATS